MEYKRREYTLFHILIGSLQICHVLHYPHFGCGVAHRTMIPAHHPAYTSPIQSPAKTMLDGDGHNLVFIVLAPSSSGSIRCVLQ